MLPKKQRINVNLGVESYIKAQPRGLFNGCKLQGGLGKCFNMHTKHKTPARIVTGRGFVFKNKYSCMYGCNKPLLLHLLNNIPHLLCNKLVAFVVKVYTIGS